MHKCQHEVPCTCDEYLNKLTVEQLINLRIQFGKLITNANKAVITGNALPVYIDGVPKLNINAMHKADRAEALRNVKKVNLVLEARFGLVIV